MPRPLREPDIPYGEPRDVVEAFAIVLRSRRLELGLTQSDFEDDDTFDRSYMSKLELAKRTPDLKALFQIAAKLQLQPHELVQRIEHLLRTAQRTRSKRQPELPVQGSTL